jgi:hypothetical protein
MPEKRVYLQGSFELILTPAKKGDDNAMPLNLVLASSLGTNPTYDFISPYGDEISLPIPEGSIKAYVEKHKENFSDPDSYIIIFAKYHRPHGEKNPIPENLKVERLGPTKSS